MVRSSAKKLLKMCLTMIILMQSFYTINLIFGIRSHKSTFGARPSVYLSSAFVTWAPIGEVDESKHMLVLKHHFKMMYNKVLQIQELTKHTFLDLGATIPPQHEAKRRRNEIYLYNLQNILHNDFESLVEITSLADQIQLRHLQHSVAERIAELQNPPDCATSRKLVCLVRTSCGIGCVLHYMGVCLFIALGTNRTMFFDFSAAGYGNAKTIFQPLTTNCENFKPSDAIEWEGENGDNPTSYGVSAVKVTLNVARQRPTLFAAFTIPGGIIDRLQVLHHDPDVWWIGQIMKYVTRLRPSINQEIEDLKTSIGFRSPIVGMHIRRTDKIREAAFRDTEEYMYHVNNWYDRHDMKKKKKVVRKVFVATDDPSVIYALKENYPSFVFVHNPYITKAGKSFQRRSYYGLLGAISDVKLLAQCDYFVGTYSSNLGRMVYELMQADGERTFDSISVDYSYHFWGGHHRFHEVIEDHDPQEGEIELRVGDKVRIRSEEYALYLGFGENQRTMKNGVYPMHKVKDVLLSAPYPGI